MATLTPATAEFSQESWWSEMMLKYQQSCGAFLMKVSLQLGNKCQAPAEGFEAHSERIQVTKLDGDDGVFKVERRPTEVKIQCSMRVLVW